MRILSVENDFDLRQELARVGADPVCWKIFAAKRRVHAFYLTGLSTAAANILKQVALGCEGDCAVHREVASGRVRRSDAVLFISRRRLPELCRRLSGQPDCVARLAAELSDLERRAFGPDREDYRPGRRESGTPEERTGKGIGERQVVSVRGRKLDLGARSYVMGILNLTPDSFYDGGRWLDPDRAAEQALRLADEGADFIDIGAESTRPGAEPVPPAVQARRILPVLRRLQGRLKVPISVDTTRAGVARRALDEGAAMVNDISGLGDDPKMAKLVAKTGVPCIVMHLPAPPRTMQRRPRYRNLMAEVITGLAAARERALAAGVKPGRLIYDPGIGFGKTVAHNLEIIRRLRELKTLGGPILLGPSRKRFIGKLLGLEPEDRLEGTVAACLLGAANGANILRVHDVKPVVRALRIHDAVGSPAEDRAEG